MAAVLAAQVAVPGVALLQSPPTRFGFQMYSGVGGVPEITADGTRVPIDDLIAAPRAEINWSRYLPEHVCHTLPKAERITYVSGHAGIRRELSCPR